MVSSRESSRNIVIYFLLGILAPIFLINVIPPGQWMRGVLPADARLNLWAMTWQWRVLPSHPLAIWDGNAFYPASNAITGSDHLFTQVLTGLPVYKLTRNPFLAYHFTLFAGYAIGAWGMYLLGLLLFRNVSAALAGAVFFTIALPRSVHATGHIQIAYLAWMPWSVYFLHRIYRRNSFFSYIGYILSTILHILSGWYTAVFHAILLMVLIPSLGVRHRQKGVFFLCIAATAMVCLMIVPFVLPYLGHSAEDPVAWAQYSAHIKDFFTPAPYTLLSHIVTTPGLWSETTLWIGFTVPFAAFAGLFFRGKKDRVGRCPPVVPYVLLSIIGLSLALGVNFPGLQPHYMPWVLLAKLPIIRGIRAPARVVFVAIFALSVLFGRTIYIINKRIPGKRLAGVLTVILVGAAMTENFSTIRIEPSKVDMPEVYRWLQVLPMEIAIAEAPTFYGTELWAFDADYMMYAALHGHPIANGYSRYVPDAFPQISAAIAALPSAAAVRTLKNFGIDFVIVHPQMCFYDHMKLLFARTSTSDEPVEAFNRIIRLSNSNYSELMSPQGFRLEMECLKSPFLNLVDRFGRDLVFYLNDAQLVDDPVECPDPEYVTANRDYGSQPNSSESISPNSAVNSWVNRAAWTIIPRALPSTAGHSKARISIGS